VDTIVPADLLEAVGHGLDALDQEVLALGGLVASRAQVGEAGGLEALALNGLELDLDEKTGGIVQGRQVGHGCSSLLPEGRP